MSADMAKFLIELLHRGENAIPAIELQSARDSDLTPQQRAGLLDLQNKYEDLCAFLCELIKQHE